MIRKWWGGLDEFHSKTSITFYNELSWVSLRCLSLPPHRPKPLFSFFLFFFSHIAFGKMNDIPLVHYSHSRISVFVYSRQYPSMNPTQISVYLTQHLIPDAFLSLSSELTLPSRLLIICACLFVVVLHITFHFHLKLNAKCRLWKSRLPPFLYPVLHENLRWSILKVESGSEL